MFAVVDRERPQGGYPVSYFRTFEEAEESRERRTLHKRGGIEVPGPEWLDIIEVERESRPCVFCGTEVESDKEETDFCRGCFYDGTFHDRRTSAYVLDALRAMDGVESASVWHTGGGCFNLGVILSDGRLLTPSIGYRDSDGSVFPEAGLPEDDTEFWALVISPSMEVYDRMCEGYDDAYEQVVTEQHLYTDQQLVEKIAELIASPPTVTTGRRKK